jgi:hypothetical protein
VETPNSTDKESIATLALVGAEVVDVLFVQFAILASPYDSHDKVVHLRN